VTAYVGAATKSGRAGIAFPLEWLLRITTGAMCIIVGVISLAIWGIVVFWPILAWFITAFFFLRWCRKMVRAYREGKS